jgi:hypothetical protein
MPFTPVWTPDTILAAIHGWVKAHQGHFIPQAALIAEHGLPSKGVVYAQLGTMEAVKRAYEARYGSRAGLIVCRRCGAQWWSPDRYDLVQHPYEARQAGQCRLPSQPRFSRRPRRSAPAAQEEWQEADARPPKDPYTVLIRTLLDEAVQLLREEYAMEGIA